MQAHVKSDASGIAVSGSARYEASCAQACVYASTSQLGVTMVVLVVCVCACACVCHSLV